MTFLAKVLAGWSTPCHPSWRWGLGTKVQSPPQGCHKPSPWLTALTAKTATGIAVGSHRRDCWAPAMSAHQLGHQVGPPGAGRSQFTDQEGQRDGRVHVATAPHGPQGLGHGTYGQPEGHEICRTLGIADGPPRAEPRPGRRQMRVARNSARRHRLEEGCGAHLLLHGVEAAAPQGSPVWAAAVQGVGGWLRGRRCSVSGARGVASDGGTGPAGRAIYQAGGPRRGGRGQWAAPAPGGQHRAQEGTSGAAAPPAPRPPARAAARPLGPRDPAGGVDRPGGLGPAHSALRAAPALLLHCLSRAPGDFAGSGLCRSSALRTGASAEP